MAVFIHTVHTVHTVHEVFFLNQTLERWATKSIVLVFSKTVLLS